MIYDRDPDAGVLDNEAFTASVKGPVYEDIDMENEYVSFYGQNLGLDEISNLFKTLETDETIKHVNFSNNITGEEMQDPERATKFFKELAIVLRNNKQLLALDLAGNHLFEYSQHPTNEHILNYVEVLADMLLKTNVKRLDLSDNYIVGTGGKMLKGLGILMRKVMVKRGEALTARFSYLNSQGIRAISDGLGARSPMQYLDISDNFGGLDPSNRPNSEGINALCMQVSQSLKLHTLKMARNRLSEPDIIMIAQAVGKLPQFLVLDLAGNDCHGLGAKAISETIVSHAALYDIGQGIRDVILSHNPLGMVGTMHICFALRRTMTLRKLGLAGCNIDDEAMELLRDALANNGSVIYLDVSRNPATEINQRYAMAETDAMAIITRFRNERNAIDNFDATKLTKAVYSSLAKKLRFLSKFELRKLHKNPSFTEDNTEMQYHLYKNEPPSRRNLFTGVVKRDSTMEERMAISKEAEKRLNYAKIIHRNVMEWYKKVAYENRVKRALEEAERKLAKINARNDEDDQYAKYNV